MSKILVSVIVALALLVVLGYFLSRSEPEVVIEPPVVAETQELVRPLERREIPPPTPEVVQNYALSGALPSLNDSDTALFNHLRLLITPIRLQLLNDDQLIRKFVLQVDNAAKGEVVYQHSPLNAPVSGLEVIEQEDGTIEIDPSSYTRYEPYADLAEAVDTSLLVAYFQFYEPLLDEAYSELGYPEGNFRSVFIEAIDQALGAPVVEGSVTLEQPELNYIYADPVLEALSPLQKQFLRMGPENTQKIQLVLQQFKARIQ